MGYKRGFTIVELLIVVVVVAILATITIVAYGGIQQRANDASVQSDLRNLGQRVEQFRVVNDRTPTADEVKAFTDIKVNKSAYGAHYTPSSLQYNLLYCRNDSMFGFVAASKSGNVFVYKNGVGNAAAALRTYTGTCTDNGLPSSPAPTWLFVDSAWTI